MKMALLLPVAAARSAIVVAALLSCVACRGPKTQPAGSPKAPEPPAAAPEPKAEPEAPAVVATVAGKPISREELEREVERQSLGRNKNPQLRKRMTARVLQGMIDDRLVLEAAAKYSVAASDAEIATDIDDMAKRLGGQDKLDAFLTKQGWNRDQYREQTRISVLRRKLRDQLFPADVSEQEIKDYHANGANTDAMGEKVRIALIEIKVPKAASDQDWKTAEARLAAVRKEIEAGLPFEDAARRESQHASARRGGVMEWASKRRSPKDLFAPAFSLSVGQIHGPFRTASGVHLIKLVEKKNESLGSLDQERESIRTLLTARKRQENQKSLAQRLAAEFSVQTSL
jgi:peptidyl-prolyl cis-trans isomerase SurA